MLTMKHFYFVKIFLINLNKIKQNFYKKNYSF